MGTNNHDGMAVSLRWLASELGGEILGNADLEVRRVVNPAYARDEHDLALVYSASVAAIIKERAIQTALVPLEPEVAGIPNQLKVARPRVALARLLEIFARPPVVTPGIHPTAFVDSTAQLAANVHIGPHCTVGPRTQIGSNTTLVVGVHIGADVRIGEGCLFFGGVCVGDRIEIGNRVIVKANAAIGNDGFSFQTVEPGSAELARQTQKAQPTNSEILRINSVGTVVIEDDVEIGANTCIDRATLHETRIGQGTKIDNLVQIAHNVQIGKKCLIVAMAGIAGSAKIGDRVLIAAQAGVADHAAIGDDCLIMPQAGVTRDLPPRSYVGGSPAEPRDQFVNNLMQVKRIKSIARKLKELAGRIDKLDGAD
ncbi:MAG: UDP-3-O-(3-hydroxymyristoyl)glucosamine N-acyltransferase [Chthoniobacterales bacterium]